MAAEQHMIVRAAAIPAGLVFNYAGRFLRVCRVYGTDAAAPVIVEEIAPIGHALAGQYGLWSADAVMRAASERLPFPPRVQA
jgi:hypothetical protein